MKLPDYLLRAECRLNELSSFFLVTEDFPGANLHAYVYADQHNFKDQYEKDGIHLILETPK